MFKYFDTKTMKLKGKHAYALKPEPTDYERGLYFLSNIVFHIVTSFFFYLRIENHLSASGKVIGSSLSGLEEIQRRVCYRALRSDIILNLSKLADSRKDAWNFERLLKSWTKVSNNEAETQRIKQEIENFRGEMKPFMDYRHKQLAHCSKSNKPTQIDIFISLDKPVKLAVQVMDSFVEGKIPYNLSLDESGAALDLRHELNLLTSIEIFMPLVNNSTRKDW